MEYLVPTYSIIVLDLHLNLTKNLSSVQDLIRFIDDSLAAYFLGHSVVLINGFTRRSKTAPSQT